MTEAIVTLIVGVGGVALGAWLARRNEKRAAGERLLVEALNDAVASIAEVANGVPDAQARYASAVSRIALHASPRVANAYRRFQDVANTGTPEGRRLLVLALQEARQDLGHETLGADDLAVLLFGPHEL